MRHIITLVALVMLASNAGAQVYPNEAPATVSVQQDGTTKATRVPILTVKNTSMQTVRVYDGAALVANVLPGGEVTTLLPGRGTRALIVRAFQYGEVTTERYMFETNRKWLLTFDHNGRAWIDLGS